MLKALPFVVQPRLQIVPIGNPETGIIHLLKKSGVSPNENPIDLQEVGTRQARIQLLTEKAISRLMKQEGVSRGEARRRLFAMPIKDTEHSTDDQAIAAQVDESIYDYLTSEEVTELLSLRENQVAIAIRTATLLIRHRVAYPIKLVAGAKAKAGDLLVEPTGFPMQAGDKIKFGSLKVEIADSHESGAETLSIKPLGSTLNDGQIGYLLDSRGRQKLGTLPEDFQVSLLAAQETFIEFFRLEGDEKPQAEAKAARLTTFLEDMLSGWTDEDTRSTLTEELIGELYRFYRIEAGGIPDLEEDTTEGENQTSTPLNTLPPGDQSTGGSSSGGSSTLVAQTSG